MGGYAASDYAFRLGEKWAIGQKSKDNGAVILIKPKIGNSRGQAFIATGYGLEARINDAYAGRIVRNNMIPYFIEEDYFGGVNAAVDVMIARLAGEYIAENEEGDEAIPAFIVIIVIIAIIVLLLIIIGGGDQNIGGDGHHRTTMPPIFFHLAQVEAAGVSAEVALEAASAEVASAEAEAADLVVVAQVAVGS